jgi:hypothetical protein
MRERKLLISSLVSSVAESLVAAAVVFLGIVAFGQSLPVQQALHSKQSQPEKKAAPPPPKHKIGPFEITINWRTRTEGWNWFEGNTGNSDHGLWNSGHAGRITVGSPTIRPGF